MKVTPQAIPEVLLIEPRVFGDDRGYFFETHSTRTWEKAGLGERFVQDNVSFSRRGTLRGLHLQNPSAQGKLVMALTGAVWDVAVDLRVGSPHFGEWVAAELSEENHRQLYVPPGFGHGFCVLSETAHFAYKCTALYEPSAELSVRFDDPELAITWPVEAPLLSPKDEAAPSLAQLLSSGRLTTFGS
jgi:dTDP-4-dehydrorhamnose 3,5-epimerase